MVSLLVVVALGVAIGSTVSLLQQRGAPPTTPPKATPSASSTPSQVLQRAEAAQQLQQVARSDLPEIITVVAVGAQSEELGTGWPIDDNGDFITNDHVVHQGISFHVVDPAGDQFPATVVNVDTALDMAEVHVSGLRESAFPVTYALPTLGQPVVVLASQGATGHQPVTDSSVNGLNKRATVDDAVPGEISNYSDLIRMPAHIYPGNSGGPVLSTSGSVVGVLTLAAQNGPGAFAIPMSELQPVLQSWLSQG